MTEAIFICKDLILRYSFSKLRAGLCQQKANYYLIHRLSKAVLEENLNNYITICMPSPAQALVLTGVISQNYVEKARVTLRI